MRTALLLAATAAMTITAATPVAAQYGGRSLSANLTGRAEVPGPGKLNARGSATLTVNAGQNRACYTVRYANIPRANMAHVHRGAVGVAGPPVITLRMAGVGRFRGCNAIPRALARDLIRRPGRFYVNVHSAAFPDGAIRGQLHR
jgi:CHRD domain